MAKRPFNEQPYPQQSVFAARLIKLSGKVQGVGFRPFVFRLANDLSLHGWVKNCLGTVQIHIQGEAEKLEKFASDLIQLSPPISDPCLESSQLTELLEVDDFKVLESDASGDTDISVPVDLFLCDDCLKELHEPSNRRYRYPFINCTQCGPRYTIIKQLPYDRINTTMSVFELCAECFAEYTRPDNRRFHAEPVACANCGPSLSYHDHVIDIHNNNESSLKAAVSALKQGMILAVKGIGGYHLMCDATQSEAVSRIRKNKPREQKPLAIMLPAPVGKIFSCAENYVELKPSEKDFLQHPSRPILLVAKNKASDLAEGIAPELNETGVMLPYSPLHHLLLNELNRPLVATSANISGEPVLTDNQQVEQRLAHVAEAYLHHNRVIERPADDSVYRFIADKPRPIRLGRGMAPLEIKLPFTLSCPVLAVGAQMKNTITLAWSDRAVVSSHIGEMHMARSLKVFEDTVNDLQALYGVSAERVICDAHDAYTTSRWAKKYAQQLDLPLQKIFHHYAHASSACFESEPEEDCLVFTWDGTGYGDNQTLWGGEALLGNPGAWKRVATMRSFNLPGGDKVSREPWRSAAALCWEMGRELNAETIDDSLLKQAWLKKINSPQSTSVGRLFDAAAALTGVCLNASYEGQAPMQLESICQQPDEYMVLPLNKKNELYVTDWEPLITSLLDDTLSASRRSNLFHGTLAFTLLQQAKAIRSDTGVNTIGFSGGVFQNRVLTEKAIDLLQQNNFKVILPSIIPVNDAGISFGQVIEFAYQQKKVAQA